MDASDRADFLENSHTTIDERVRRRCENALRFYAQQIGVMPSENNSPVIREADSPSIEWTPAIGSTPVLRRGFRQARGRWYRSIYTQTPGLIEQILREYMQDSVVEEGRSDYSPVTLVQRQDQTFRIKVEPNDTESGNNSAEFDFSEFNNQEPRLPSSEPELEQNDRTNKSVHSPIPEEDEDKEGEASE